MIKIVKTNDNRFRLKEFDEEGNSVKVFEEIFDTEAEAQHFIDAQGIQTPTAPEADTTVAPSAPEETAPVAPVEGSDPVAPSEGTMPTASPENTVASAGDAQVSQA